MPIVYYKKNGTTYSSTAPREDFGDYWPWGRFAKDWEQIYHTLFRVTRTGSKGETFNVEVVVLYKVAADLPLFPISFNQGWKHFDLTQTGQSRLWHSSKKLTFC